MMHRNQVKLLKEMMQADQFEIADRFANLPRACRLPVAAESREMIWADMIWIPPIKDKFVVLLAHSDTIWNDALVDLFFHDGRLLTNSLLTGTGADCRAGCAALWALRSTGHAILLTTGEESGCVGVSQMKSQYPEIIAAMSKAIALVEFDRRGKSEVVSYSHCTEDDLRIDMANDLGFTAGYGSFTDVVELESLTEVQGVNLAVGFYNEHTNEETLVVDDWWHTVSLVKKWLRNRVPKLEQYCWRKATLISSGKSYFDCWGDDDVDFMSNDLDQPVEQFESACPDCGELVEYYLDTAGDDLRYCTVCGWTNKDDEDDEDDDWLQSSNLFDKDIDADNQDWFGIDDESNGNCSKGGNCG